MTIKANFIVSNIIVDRRRQLAVSEEDITTIMKTTIREVVKNSLNANQRLTAVNITGIDEISIDGSSGSTIDSQLMLTEKCASNDCEAQLSNTTMNSTVISYITQEIKNGNFDEVFQENADTMCADTTCPEIKDGTVVGEAFNETKRGQVVVPTEAPSANPTTLTPTSSQPTSVSPTSAAPTPMLPTTKSPSSIATKAPSANPTTKMPTSKPTTASPITAAPTPTLPTTKSPSSLPTESPSANPTTKMPVSSQPTTVGPSVAPLALPTAAPSEYPTYLPTEAPSAVR
jgi:hypothetical protein